MAEVKETLIPVTAEDIKKIFASWGNYRKRENCLYLYDNDCLKDENFIELVRKNNVKLQLNLF